MGWGGFFNSGVHHLLVARRLLNPEGEALPPAVEVGGF
jgi:hypothetical protein